MRYIFIFILALATTNAYCQDSVKAEVLDEVYGKHCGAVAGVGDQPALRVDIEKLIYKGNIAEIDKWLNSDSYVKKTYAAEALIRLENDGTELSTEQISRIVKIKRSKRKITTCFGCNTIDVKTKVALEEYRLNEDS